jgi:hypothetical protein
MSFYDFDWILIFFSGVESISLVHIFYDVDTVPARKRELRHSKFELIREWNLHIKIKYSLPIAHTTL